MKLYPPFFIGARLSPALKVGDATLSLVGAHPSCDRIAAEFVLDFPDGTSYEDDRMLSGLAGFPGGRVEAFESFLDFLEAAVESYGFEQRNHGRTGENTHLFPRHIVEWAADQPYLEDARCGLLDENGDPRFELIID